MLEAIGDGPAHVFGSSGGAVTGLALVAHYPAVCKPSSLTSPRSLCSCREAEEASAGMDDIYDTYRDHAAPSACRSFAAFTGINMRPQGEDAAPQPPSAEAVATSERLFRHGRCPSRSSSWTSPPCRARRRVVVAGGTTSKGQFA